VRNRSISPFRQHEARKRSPGHTGRSWGRLIRHPGGLVEDELWPSDQAGSRSTPAIRSPSWDGGQPPDRG
jgi:hypothetical protein